MKLTSFSQTAGAVAIALAIATAGIGRAQNAIYGYSTPGGQFAFDVTNIPVNTVYPTTEPTLNLTAGATYRFIIGTTAFEHPVVVATNNTASPPVGSAYSDASPQVITSGAITVTLPATNYPTTLYYRCNNHLFGGVINVLPPPPPNEIVSVSVTTNVMLVSTGTTNTWVLVPEFNSNLVNGVWATVPGYTNVFADGTNTTTFGRLDAIAGPDVFLRIRQSPPSP